jgi:branched-chain amino acid transport system substrate-binding protein
MTLVAAVLVVGLLVGAGAGYMLAPSDNGDGGGGGGTTEVIVEKHPLEGVDVQLGYITSAASGLETMVPFLEEIMQVDLNEYAAKLGHDTTFEYLIDQADSQAAIHLEKVQSFKSMGIEIFIGGPWSSMAQASLSYVNENDMLMVSSSSTSPMLAIADDRLFRICPTDYVQAPAIAGMLENWGIEAVIIFQRADSWGDGIYNIFEQEWTDRGYTVIERVRYAAESTEYSNYLQTINDKIATAADEYGYDRIAVQTMSFDENVVYCTQTVDYPETRKVIWFGCESTGRSQRMVDDAGLTAVDLRFFSSLMTPAKSWKWESLESRYIDLTAQPAGFYTGCDYDAAWTQVLSILETDSIKADDAANVIIDVARNYWGATGWVDLDDNGDRKPGKFDIWGYYDDGGVANFQTWGLYDGVTLDVTWDDALLAENGVTRPGKR